MTFTGSRLRVGRERRGLTKRALADDVGLTERSVFEHEANRADPTEEHVKAYAERLRFPVSFFEQPELDVPEPGEASFRAMKSMAAAHRNGALAAGALCFEVNGFLERWLEEQGLETPEPSIPDLRGMDPEIAALTLRMQWGLEDRAVKNMVHRLENHGVRVFSLVQDRVEVDAFSLWRHGRPFVFLDTKKSAERGRFDAAHELGHLVLHRHGAPAGREAEQQADEFASAFLMPRASVAVHAPRVVVRENLLTLKRVWGVSAMALLMRMHRLGLVSDWQYRCLCIENSDLRKTEPNASQRETSQLLAKMFTKLSEQGLTKREVARALHLHIPDLEALIFGLVVIPDEASQQRDRPARGSARKLGLRVISSS